MLTNYHVIAPGPEDDPAVHLADLTLRFGYVTTPDSSGAAGVCLRLAPQPLVKYSPIDKLDYALLRLTSGSRGDIAAAAFDLQPPRQADTNIHILQHPEGKTMQVAFSHNGITGIYASDGLLQYVSNTALGSSGSPCFNDRWELVALHHAQVAAPFGVKGEGILFTSIYQEIAAIVAASLERGPASGGQES